MRSTLGTNRDDDLVAVSESAVAAPRRQGRRRGLRGGRGRGTAPEPNPVQPNAPRTARTVAETQGQSRVELRELERRAEVFRHGEWLTLLRDASRTPASRSLTAKPFSAGDETTSSLMSSATRTAGPKGESRARRGSEAGPSGMTNEHLRLLLDDPCDLAILHKAQPVALPTLSCRSLCLPLCGLRQPNGCVRALVAGDVQAMLEALRSRPELEALLPFRRRFYGAARRYVWTDDAGADSEVLQAEGGE
eukprot:s3121_g8.t1